MVRKKVLPDGSFVCMVITPMQVGDQAAVQFDTRNEEDANKLQEAIYKYSICIQQVEDDW